jgi:hypothetical protein
VGTHAGKTGGAERERVRLQRQRTQAAAPKTARQRSGTHCAARGARAHSPCHAHTRHGCARVRAGKAALPAEFEALLRVCCCSESRACPLTKVAVHPRALLASAELAPRR